MSSPEEGSEGAALNPEWKATNDPVANIDQEMAGLRALAQKVLDLPEGEVLPAEIMQQAISTLIRIYAVRFQMGERVQPLDDGYRMPPTAVMIMASQLLRASKLEIFELSMWQLWSEG